MAGYLFSPPLLSLKLYGWKLYNKSSSPELFLCHEILHLATTMRFQSTLRAIILFLQQSRWKLGSNLFQHIGKKKGKSYVTYKDDISRLQR